MSKKRLKNKAVAKHRVETDMRRFDFIQEIVGFDEERNVAEVILKPNPNRYEWQDIEGKKYRNVNRKLTTCANRILTTLSHVYNSG